MSRTIVVTSGKGGVGKTTVTCNLGIALAKMGIATTLVDVDIGLNNVDVVMGMENRIVYDLYDVLSGRCRINEALVQDITHPSLYVLSSSKTNVNARIDVDDFKYLITRLSDIYDVVLLDCPAGIDVGFHRTVSAAKEAIVVTTPHISAIRDADKVITLLSTYKLNDMGLVVNRVRGDLVARGDMLSGGDIARLLSLKPLGMIPEEDSLTLLGRMDNKSGRAENAYDLLAHNLMNGYGKLYDCSRGYRGLLGRIRAFMR